MTDHMPELRIDIVSDVVCLWCCVCNRQLEEALERFKAAQPAIPITVRWHPSQLNRDSPPDGAARSDDLERKFGTDDTRGLCARVRRTAGAVALELDMEAIARQPNALAPHAMLELAAEEGCQNALAEVLFGAYFQEGRDLTV
jgi:predicted DsbA family dithiol-disulfide isomerase